MTSMAAPVRCAIYPRKSSEEGLEQSYNSLDAQRDACAAYVLSQAGEGWTLLPQPYDDGGYSGGTMERPALQCLLADIEARRVDVVVVYKVDRLTRALADFARIVEIMDGHGASVVSVTQAFNTTTSMGRLTLNVLLSFAQFEREVTGERIRDKIAASKRKGMWMGGIVPLGYRPAGRTLEVIEAEADLVRHIFHRYQKLGSVHRLRDALQAEGVVSKRRVSRSGREFGGAPFGWGALYHLLRNPIYLGEIRHKGVTYPGQHPAIVDRELFEAVQCSLDENTAAPGEATGRGRTFAAPEKSPLRGILFDGNGERMSPVSARKKGGATYRYYVSQSLQTGRRNAIGQKRRINAGLLEAFVYDRLARLDLVPVGPAAPDWEAARSLLQRVEVDATQLRMVLTALPKLQALAADATALCARLGDEAALTLMLGEAEALRPSPEARGSPRPTSPA